MDYFIKIFVNMKYILPMLDKHKKTTNKIVISVILVVILLEIAPYIEWNR